MALGFAPRFVTTDLQRTYRSTGELRLASTPNEELAEILVPELDFEREREHCCYSLLDCYIEEQFLREVIDLADNYLGIHPDPWKLSMLREQAQNRLEQVLFLQKALSERLRLLGC